MLERMTTRTPLIAANWKMHKLPSEVEAWARALLEALEGRSLQAEVAILAPYTHLPALRDALAGTPIAYGAQDVSAAREGAFTGEVAAEMLADLGARYAIVGHSERREYHREDDALIKRKLSRALEVGLVPILCVGEKLTEREAGRAEEVVLRQLEAALAEVALSDSNALVVAYEPVWAIGTGKTAHASDAQEMGATIRRALQKRYGDTGAGVRVLYGGSMKPDNAREILMQPDVDGGLVGGASLEVASLVKLVEAAHA
jgi:triosephosphate isomerase